MATYEVKVVGQIVKSFYVFGENKDDAIENAKEIFENDYHIQRLDREFIEEAEFDLIETIRCEEKIL